MNKVYHLDQHLFIEALAFSALYIQTTPLILEPQREAVEKILLLIEKISSSEGVKKARQKKVEDKIKTMPVERIDIMGPFRKKYSWYY